MKTGKRKMRRDQGRAEFEEMHDVRNLPDVDESKHPDAEISGEESDASSPQQVSSKAVKLKAKNSPAAKETLLPREGESCDEESDHEPSPTSGASPSKSKKQQIEEQETAEDKERQAVDMKRLEEIRMKREEDKRLRHEHEAAEKEAEKGKKEQEKLAKEKEKEDAKNKPENQAVRDAFAKLIPEVDSQKSLNELNQQNDCKKLLKPLLKKASVKTLNKATLTALCEGVKQWKVFEENNVVYLKRAKE